MRFWLYFLGCACALSGQTDWPVYGGSAANTHYSNLKQIDRSNVKNLKVAWTYDSGDAYEGSELQCNPLVIGGVLYATTPKLRVIALDAATGKQRWSFDPHDGQPVKGKMRNRGLAYWANGNDQRLFVSVRNWLFALDARTGQPITSFGQRGRLDLREGLGRDPQQISITSTSPGVVYKDLLIMGSLVSEGLPSAPGDIRAYDVRTGKQRWAFHTIPHPGEPGYETWPRDGWEYLGGANAWSGLSLDVQRGLVFVPTGSAAFDFYGANRTGDNLYANCLLALKADTGERVWHFQTVRHDVWDRDLPTPPALVTVKRDGRSVDAVAQPTKSGYLYLFERETGKPLFPITEHEVSTVGVDGEVLSTKQPLPAMPPPFSRQVFTPDLVTNRTPEAHAAVLAKLKSIKSGPQFTPPSHEGTVIFPGFDGGAEWGGPAFDPTSGLLYVNANEMPWVLRLVDRPKREARVTSQGLYQRYCASCHRADREGTPPEFPSLVNLSKKMNAAQTSSIIKQGVGRMPSFSHLAPASVEAIATWLVSGEERELAAEAVSRHEQKFTHDGYNKFLDPEGYPAIAPPWGTLAAIDLNEGKIKWQIPFGEYPELVKKGMKNTGSENYGGAVVTAGGLLFIGATNFDKKMRAFDKASGELLWETTLPAAGNATPATYFLNGKQYVVIAAGGGKSGAPSGGSYVAFALPSP